MAPVGQMATQWPQSMQRSHRFRSGREVCLVIKPPGGPDASAAGNAQTPINFDHGVILYGVFILLHRISGGPNAAVRR